MRKVQLIFSSVQLPQQLIGGLTTITDPATSLRSRQNFSDPIVSLS